MYAAAPRLAGGSRTGLALGAGLLAGIALQLQQAALAVWWVYAAFVLLAPILYARVATKRVASARMQCLVLIAGLAFAWGLTGLRAVVFVSQALNPALEGRDVWVTGVVADMAMINVLARQGKLTEARALLRAAELVEAGLE